MFVCFCTDSARIKPRSLPLTRCILKWRLVLRPNIHYVQETVPYNCSMGNCLWNPFDLYTFRFFCSLRGSDLDNILTKWGADICYYDCIGNHLGFDWCCPFYETNASTLSKYRFKGIILIIIKGTLLSLQLSRSLFCEIMLHLLVLDFHFSQNTTLHLFFFFFLVDIMLVCLLETRSIYVVLAVLELVT